MNNITQLNYQETVLVSGGTPFGNLCGYLGALAGTGIFCLEYLRQRSGSSIPKYNPGLLRFYISLNLPILLSAVAGTITIVTYQAIGSFLFALAGETGEKLFKKHQSQKI